MGQLQRVNRTGWYRPGNWRKRQSRTGMQRNQRGNGSRGAINVVRERGPGQVTFNVQPNVTKIRVTLYGPQEQQIVNRGNQGNP